MGVLAMFSGIREIKKGVVCDMSGTLQEAMGESDAESVAAVLGFTASSFQHVGTSLGMGELRRISITGKTATCVATALDNYIVAVFTEPTATLTTLEKNIDSALRKVRRRLQ